MIIHILVTSWLNYCNPLYTGPSLKLVIVIAGVECNLPVNRREFEYSCNSFVAETAMTASLHSVSIQGIGDYQ